MLFVGNGAVDRENLLCKGIAIMHVTKGTSTCASASCCSGEGALTSNFCEGETEPSALYILLLTKPLPGTVVCSS